MNSIVSYPERGEGGKNTYRGNCSPKLLEDLIAQYHISEINDYMCGSGTTEDAANKAGIKSHCYDLNRGFDLLHCDIPERSEFTFWHPPYGTMITYAGEQYDAKMVEQKYGFDPRQFDLSREQPWEDFVKEMNSCMLKQFAALEKGGRMGVLVGDMKKKGKLYSMILELVKPGTIEQIVIKAQHNCWSDNIRYSNRNFIPIQHEYLLIVRKDNSLVFDVQFTQTCTCDVRDLKATTWRDVIIAVMESKHRPLSLQEIYKEVVVHRKAKSNHHWQEKIRQTLYIYPQYFQRTGDNTWQLAS